jgi:hypothetical protein
MRPSWANSLVGDYHYGAALVGGKRYAIIRNSDVVERVRIITPNGNPIVWEAPAPLTQEALDAILNSLVADVAQADPHG